MVLGVLGFKVHLIIVKVLAFSAYTFFFSSSFYHLFKCAVEPFHFQWLFGGQKTSGVI